MHAYVQLELVLNRSKSDLLLLESMQDACIVPIPLCIVHSLACLQYSGLCLHSVFEEACIQGCVHGMALEILVAGLLCV